MSVCVCVCVCECACVRVVCVYQCVCTCVNAQDRFVYTHNRVTCLLTGTDRSPGAVITQKHRADGGGSYLDAALTALSADDDCTSTLGRRQSLGRARWLVLRTRSLVSSGWSRVDSYSTLQKTQTRTRFTIHLQ